MIVKSMSWQDWSVASPFDPESFFSNTTFSTTAGGISRRYILPQDTMCQSGLWFS